MSVVKTKYSTKYYNEKGELHREDGPAMEYTNGNKYWYQNRKCHRVDGPAVEWSTGHKEWYQNGKRHRIDGLACEYKWWYYQGEEIKCNSQSEFERIIRLKCLW